MQDELIEVFEPTFGAVVQADLADCPEEALASALGSISLPRDIQMQKALRRLPTHDDLLKDMGDERDILLEDCLTADQRLAFDAITKRKGGLFALVGGPGTGKSTLTKMMMLHFTRLGMKTQISPHVVTCAVLFITPVNRPL